MRWPSGSRKKARISQSDSTGGGQEGRAPVAQGRERRPAVGDPDRHRMADAVGVGRRRERDRGLVGGRAAAGDQEQPRPEGAQDARRAAVLAVDLGAQDVAVERRARSMSATTRMWVSSIPSAGKPSLTAVRPTSSRLAGRSPAPDLGIDVERHDRAVLLVVAPRLARHAPHDLELVAVGIGP